MKYVAATLIAAATMVPFPSQAAKFKIIVEYASKNDPCRVVAGVRRGAQIKKTPKYVQYEGSRSGSRIVFYYAKPKPTCALIYPSKTLF